MCRVTTVSARRAAATLTPRFRTLSISSPDNNENAKPDDKHYCKANESQTHHPFKGKPVFIYMVQWSH